MVGVVQMANAAEFEMCTIERALTVSKKSRGFQTPKAIHGWRKKKLKKRGVANQIFPLSLSPSLSLFSPSTFLQ
jgi:hypothetical protein